MPKWANSLNSYFMKSSKQVDLETKLEIPFFELDSSELKLLVEHYSLSREKHRLMKIVKPSGVKMMSNVVYEIVVKDSSNENSRTPSKNRKEDEYSGQRSISVHTKPGTSSKTATSKIMPGDPAKKNVHPDKIQSNKSRLQNAIKARMKIDPQKDLYAYEKQNSRK